MTPEMRAELDAMEAEDRAASSFREFWLRVVVFVLFFLFPALFLWASL